MNKMINHWIRPIVHTSLKIEWMLYFSITQWISLSKCYTCTSTIECLPTYQQIWGKIIKKHCLKIHNYQYSYYMLYLRIRIGVRPNSSLQNRFVRCLLLIKSCPSQHTSDVRLLNTHPHATLLGLVGGPITETR
jgi:hypothetical protein